MKPNDTKDLLTRWVSELADQRVLMGKRDAVELELEGWLAHFSQAAEGDRASEHELQKLVASHAKALGQEGRPASATIMQVLVLDDLLPPDARALRKVVREMSRVAADAHMLGLSARLRELHHAQLREGAPVFRFEKETVIAFMIGAMSSDLIDGVLGRLLRECQVANAKVAILDLFGAEPDDDRFHRTVADLLDSEGGWKIQLVLTGLRDPAGTLAALERVGAKTARIQLFSRLSEYLDPRWTQG